MMKLIVNNIIDILRRLYCSFNIIFSFALFQKKLLHTKRLYPE